MARLGVTYQDIANAANQLLGQSKSPTIELIRQFLGTGSSTTIANHLRQWRAEQDGTAALSRTENLPPEMIALMKGLWERLTYLAQEKVTVVAAKHQQALDELQQELSKYKTNNQRWQQLFNQWTQEKSQLMRDKLTLEEGVAFMQKENSSQQIKQEGLLLQLQDRQERIAELHHLHAQTQTNLEHFRESSREQRLIEQQQYEQQRQGLQSEIKTFKEQMMVMREKISFAEQQYQSLQQTYTTLEKTHVEIKSKYEIQQLQLAETEKYKHEYLNEKEHWQHRYQEVQKTLEIKTVQFLTSESEVKILSQQLADAKESLADLQDQIKLLGQEKWLLAQEKAQMEGQLKQMMI